MAERNRTPKKPIIFYYLISLVILFVINAVVLPMFMRRQVTEVDYSTFLAALEENRVLEVELSGDGQEIAFIALDRHGQRQTYVTVAMPDPNLLDRLRSSENEIRFSRIRPTQPNPFLTYLFSLIVPALIIIGLGRLFSRQLQTRMGNMMSFGKSSARIYVKAQTGKTFADVAGQDEAKEALMEIVDFLHDPEKYTSIGASLPKGALLVGPPGTGKTLLAQAVAGEAQVPFFSISGSEFVEMFVGLGAAKVRDLFKQAEEKAPCIVFIDEIDTIGKKRDHGGFSGNDEREQTLNQLLTEMDGFDSRKGVVLLAATNRPESLDPALLRPGRFDRRIPVELPDLAGRIAILKVHAAKVAMSPHVDLEAIARSTAGASGADLANVINEAALRAVRMGRSRVEQEDLEESVEVVIAGYQKKNAAISPQEKEIIAYHEIGHALVAAKQSDTAPVHKITIIPRTSGALGYTMQVEEDDRYLLTKEEAFARLAILTGGRAAEELVFNTATTGAANDIEKATRLARAMVTRYGMSDKFGMVALETVTNPYLGDDTMPTCSSETAAAVDKAVMELINKAHERAISILKDNMDQLHALARYLLAKETITGEEFMQLLKA
ncbi:MAG: ATP-dependent zinc metalloprotease FtsH [Limnochordia bacterium]|jgi:cell division protease FtsH|nr:ATP-dependent zinc metalloprotease FtsH [Bacillota bacterium]NLL09070.1 ATP-dependent zinc metalloprotease FtsH [Bacillota bacterium]HBG08934.1 cell division protein FtsH [Bacillota bacterium]